MRCKAPHLTGRPHLANRFTCGVKNGLFLSLFPLWPLPAPSPTPPSLDLFRVKFSARAGFIISLLAPYLSSTKCGLAKMRLKVSARGGWWCTDVFSSHGYQTISHLCFSTLEVARVKRDLTIFFKVANGEKIPWWSRSNKNFYIFRLWR